MCRQTLYGSSVRLLYKASKLATQIADWFSAGALHLQILLISHIFKYVSPDTVRLFGSLTL